MCKVNIKQGKQHETSQIMRSSSWRQPANSALFLCKISKLWIVFALMSDHLNAKVERFFAWIRKTLSVFLTSLTPKIKLSYQRDIFIESTEKTTIHKPAQYKPNKSAFMNSPSISRPFLNICLWVPKYKTHISGLFFIVD